jgi:hypothetical protein
MKSKWITALCILALGWCSVRPCQALDNGTPEAVIVDTVVVRPACFAVTVVGTAFFVVALPFAAISKSTKSTAQALVVKPAKATFTRPLGQFDELSD